LEPFAVTLFLLLAKKPIGEAPEAIAARVNPQLKAAVVAQLAQVWAGFGRSKSRIG
jgi:hypothetical protein